MTKIYDGEECLCGECIHNIVCGLSEFVRKVTEGIDNLNGTCTVEYEIELDCCEYELKRYKEKN